MDRGYHTFLFRLTVLESTRWGAVHWSTRSMADCARGMSQRQAADACWKGLDLSSRTLWRIAESFYGDGRQYPGILAANAGRPMAEDWVSPCHDHRHPSLLADSLRRQGVPSFWEANLDSLVRAMHEALAGHLSAPERSSVAASPALGGGPAQDLPLDLYFLGVGQGDAAPGDAPMRCHQSPH